MLLNVQLKKSADLQHVKTEEHVPKLQLEDICVRALWGFLERIAKVSCWLSKQGRIPKLRLLCIISAALARC